MAFFFKFFRFSHLMKFHLMMIIHFDVCVVVFALFVLSEVGLAIAALEVPGVGAGV